MKMMKSAVMALTAAFCVTTVGATAEAAHVGEGHIGGVHMGGHMGRMGGHYGGYFGHVGHSGHGHYRHGWYGPGFALYAPYYSGYYDDYGYGDCYRVYRHHRWRTVCD